MILAWIVGFALLGSVGAVAAASILLLFPAGGRRTLVPLLISYATGTLLAVALVDLLPEAIERATVESMLVTVLSPYSPITTPARIAGHSSTSEAWRSRSSGRLR